MTAGPREHESRTAYEREKKLPDAGVEARGCFLQHRVVCVERKFGAHPREVVHHRAVRNHHALGPAGGAGRVDDICEVVATGARWRIRRGRGGDRLPLGIQRDHDRALAVRAARNGVSQRGGGEQHRHARIVEHEGESIGGIVRIQWHVVAARLQHTEHRDDELWRPLDADRDADVRPHALRRQIAANRFGALVELTE